MFSLELGFYCRSIYSNVLATHLLLLLACLETLSARLVTHHSAYSFGSDISKVGLEFLTEMGTYIAQKKDQNLAEIAKMDAFIQVGHIALRIFCSKLHIL